MFRIWLNNFFNSQHPFWRVLAIGLIAAGLLIGAGYMIELGYHYTPFGKDVDIAKTGAVGDFIAGVVGTVFALAGFIMVYLTYSRAISLNMLHLRGFLRCPECHKMLTGSVSKGKYYRYYYYHCDGTKCKCRFKAEVVNSAFEKELQKFQITPAAAELFKCVVMDEIVMSGREDLDARRSIAKEIEEQESMLSSARKKYLKDEIEEQDFKIIKKECTEQLQRLEARLSDLPNRNGEIKTVHALMEKLVIRHINLLDYFKNQDIETKRQLISSMYPENLCFDGTEHRTLYLSEPLSLILQVNSMLQGIKKGEKLDCFSLSPEVAPRGIEPPT